jgi:hypothetical protein
MSRWGDRVYLETVRPQGSGFPRHERRVVSGAASFDWGWSHHLLGTQTVGDFKGEIFALRSTYGGPSKFSPAGNCFGSQF